jgi:hypothetical protein
VGLLVAPEPPDDPEPPPVELLPEPPAEVPPPAVEPPELPLPEPEPPVAPLAPLPEDSSDGLLDSPAPLVPEVPLPVLLDEVFVDVVLVAADACASFSAEVSVGGMMFGVLLGTASAAFELPPQAPSVRAQRVRTLAPTATREARAALALVLKAAPCAGRRSGSR